MKFVAYRVIGQVILATGEKKEIQIASLDLSFVNALFYQDFIPSV